MSATKPLTSGGFLRHAPALVFVLMFIVGCQPQRELTAGSDAQSPRHQWSQKVDRPYSKQLDLWQREARGGYAAERTFAVPVKEALQALKIDRLDAEKR